MAAPGPVPESSRLEKERAFHDEWATAVAPDQVAVEAAFENLTAPENRFILSQMGDLRGRRVLDLGSGLGESAIYFALKGAEVTATDISPARADLGARFRPPEDARCRSADPGPSALAVP